jgi:hypothetical protein
MARRLWMQRFARWHIWLGWLVAVPMLLWVASGLFMVIKPIDEVRGENVRARAASMEATGLVLPRLSGPVDAVALVSEPAGPTWIVRSGTAEPHRYSARDGRDLGAVNAAEARTIAAAAYAGPGRIEALRRFTADTSPLDLRKARPSWQAKFSDGTHVYVDAGTGEVLALRTRFWRAYDLMWGLHIMDLQTREDPHHPILILFAALALAGSVIGTVLLFRRRRSPVRAAS